MTDEEIKIPADDDWLDDLDNEPEFAEIQDGLDTSAFDEMFGELNPTTASDDPGAGNAAEASVPAVEPEPEPVAAGPAPAESAVDPPEPEVTEAAGQEDLGVELDQSSIDSLLNGGDGLTETAGSQVADEPDSTVAAEPVPEAAPATAAVSEPAAVETVTPDSASIEPVPDLPAAEDLPPIADNDPDQAFSEEGDELDELFGGTSGDSITLGGSEDAAASAFTEEESDETTTASAGGVSSPEATPVPEAEPVNDFPDLMADTVLEQTAAEPAPRTDLAALLADRKIMAIATGVAAALIFVITALVLRSGPEKAAVPAVTKVAVKTPAAVAPVVKPAAPVIVEKKVAVNKPPHAVPMQAVMPVDRDRVELVLAGEGQERNTLNFEVVSLPAHGSLSGDPPELTYIAGRDFSGRDSFSFRVTDSGGVSEPVQVEISRARVTAAGVRIIEPRRPMFRVAARKIKTSSTSGRVIIDGRKLWREINPEIPLDRKAVFEVRGRPAHGRLKKVAPLVYHYIPEPYDRGTERFSYRFRNMGLGTKRASLEIAVENGDPPPEVRIAEFSAKYFRVGERVVIDASPTRDDERGSLRFRWLQNQGVDVRLERLNNEGSKVSFVVPSYFYTTDYPEPVLTVEARDAGGQVGRGKVRVPVRRDIRAEDWDGLNLRRGRSGGSGGLLPWAVVSR